MQQRRSATAVTLVMLALVPPYHLAVASALPITAAD
jgi:hypothetical protein